MVQSRNKPRHDRPSRQNRVRIIGGAWRSRIIEFPDASGLRPTPDRVRETLFNWLGQSMRDKNCLDLFSGSGALGFEAASRGAVSVIMVESAKPATDALERNRLRLGAVQCRIVSKDALRAVELMHEKFDVIFLDPPYASEFLPALLPKLAACLKPDGRLYAEWHEPLADIIARMPGSPWRVLRAGKAGAVHFALLSATETSPTNTEATP
jgi:16S rRNA (guanine966-N2)-methyltransferase